MEDVLLTSLLIPHLSSLAFNSLLPMLPTACWQLPRPHAPRASRTGALPNTKSRLEALLPNSECLTEVKKRGCNYWNHDRGLSMAATWRSSPEHIGIAPLRPSHDPAGSKRPGLSDGP